MGLFDFLKKKQPAPAEKVPAEPIVEPIIVEQANEPISEPIAEEESTPEFIDNTEQTEKVVSHSLPTDENGRYLGDLSKTDIIRRLCQVPEKDRDDEWKEALLEAIPTASFRCGNPQVIDGPDGMPYFHVLLPEPNQPFQCYVLEAMLDDFILENGFGIVLNATKTQPDWVFSHGDLVNYHIRKEFYTQESMFHHVKDSGGHDQVTVENDTKVQVGQPSEEILPTPTRKILNELLTSWGLPAKVYLMNWGEGKGFDLVFNITPEMFDNEKHRHTVMHILTWYLPRDYTIVGMKDSKHFEEL